MYNKVILIFLIGVITYAAVYSFLYFYLKHREATKDWEERCQLLEDYPDHLDEIYQDIKDGIKPFSIRQIFELRGYKKNVN